MVLKHCVCGLRGEEDDDTKVLSVTFNALCWFMEDSIGAAENCNVLCRLHQLDFFSFKK